MELAVENKVDRYSAYQYAGEDWLGEVPAHWEIRKLKHIFFEKKMKSNPQLNAGSISFGEVVVKNDEKIPESTKASYQEVLEGEFLINPLNLNYDLISLRIALSRINVVVSSGYIVLKNHEDIDKQYYKYLLHRYDVAYMKLLGSGVRQTISFNHIANSLLLFPPKEEQTAIAQFLDRKTAQIDKAIAQKEKLIELLKERRQILIHKAVTRGLNPNLKLKPSGVEWIGEIPEHWEVKKLNHMVKLLVDGTHFSPKSDFEGEYKYVTAKNIKENGFDFGDLTFVSKKDHDSIYKRCPVKKGDILYIKDGATAGVAMVNDLDEEFSLLSSVALIRLIDFVDKEYFKYFLNSNLIKSFVLTQISGGAITRLTLELIKMFKIVVPPIEEQYLIVEYMHELDKKIFTLINSENTVVEKLKEYKATLINSAVTGKIKVV